MSFSNAPDLALLGSVAGALAVDEAFVEKDWYVVQAIASLADCRAEGIVPVFSGGTSLLKGHGLINRFSEDIDFKLDLSADFAALSGAQQSKRLRALRDAIVAAWREQGFEILDVQTHNAGRFFRIELVYPSTIDPHTALRSHILAELSARPPLLPPVGCAIGSFVAKARSGPSEIADMPCVDPLETALDKLSALSWRLIARDRDAPDDDPTVIRHLHDLAALEVVVQGSRDFAVLAGKVLPTDSRRGGVAADMAPAERLRAMLDLLGADTLYRSDYERYVAGMVFAGPPALFSFDDALGALARICAAANPN